MRRTGRPPPPRLCKCIQVAADATLDRQEQNLAATFFADPHQAQVIRQSKDRSHGLFWEALQGFLGAGQGVLRQLIQKTGCCGLDQVQRPLRNHG